MPAAGKQTEYGKAFEYACVDALYRKYRSTQEVTILDSDAMKTARNFFNSIGSLQNNLKLAADAAIRGIEKLEPRLPYPEGNSPLYISLQTDAHGMEGDVRDVLCVRRQNDWQIGFSCKHNHHAVKHSRLSGSIDFGEKWFGYPCSKQYFDEVRPLFDRLDHLKKEARAKNTIYKWSDIPKKAEEYYIPILQSFMDELQRIYAVHPDTPTKLVQYLVGTYDFYKITTEDAARSTRIDAMNYSGTLNQPSGNYHPAMIVPRLRFPTEIVQIKFKPGSDNTIRVICDEGWTLFMRLHNAATEVEPSLKFDVSLGGSANSFYSFVEPWSNS